ncbi:MAG: FTR1 family protein [Chitinophagales bacterium]|nr:FTR1 family protein [Chitinophagales bacterium]MDW8418921.1 FTR1 family protein [Chitinophagales bacterium]
MRVNCRLLLCVSLWFFFGFAYAGGAENARALIHTLNYLSNDYPAAVVAGKVTDAEEYEEMLEFSEDAVEQFEVLSGNLPAVEAQLVAKSLKELAEAIRQKSDAHIIREKIASIKKEVIRLTGLEIYPIVTPRLPNGRKLYATHCAKCHGAEGRGDGPEGAEMRPPPRNFYDPERMSRMDAAHVFNTIRLGIEGTGMRAFPELSDEDVWDVSFFVLSLRHESTTPDTAGTAGITLENAATTSDDEFLHQKGLTAQQLAAVRTLQIFEGHHRYLRSATERLLQALSAYQNNQYHEASRRFYAAYIEGIEPVENHIRASDPVLAEEIEKQFNQLRRLLDSRTEYANVQRAVYEILRNTRAAEKLLLAKTYSFWMTFAMSASILLREGLEAFLVILVILSVLHTAGKAGATRWVHAGWVMALLAGLALWWLITVYAPDMMLYAELAEGVISLVAVAMLLYVGFWLHSKSEAGKWKEYVRERINGAMQNGSHTGLALLSFFIAFREVFESLIFMTALHLESSGKQGYAILSGLLVAAALVGVFAWLALRHSRRLPIPKLFRISSVVIGLLAVVLAGKGIHALQETGVISINALPLPKFEWLGVYPTAETLAAQLTAAMIVVWMLVPIRALMKTKPASVTRG